MMTIGIPPSEAPSWKTLTELEEDIRQRLVARHALWLVRWAKRLLPFPIFYAARAGYPGAEQDAIAFFEKHHIHLELHYGFPGRVTLRRGEEILDVFETYGPLNLVTWDDGPF